MRATEAAALGLLHGPAELLPISSSGHLALLGRDIDQATAVAVHAGTAAALLVGLRGEAAEILRGLDGRRVAFHVLAAAPAAVVGVAFADAIEARLGGTRTVAAGMAAGGLALALADRSPTERTRDDAGPADGLWIGLAQACALWPGVSRNGATLAAARRRGFARPDANRLSREVGVPLLIGATALKAWRARGVTRAQAAAAAASFASTLASLPLLRLVDADRPLWPWAAYRCGLALVLVGRSGR